MAHRFDWIFVDATDTLVRVRRSVGEVYASVAQLHGFELSPVALDAAFRHALVAASPPAFPGATPADWPRLERDWWYALVRRAFESLPAPATDAAPAPIARTAIANEMLLARFPRFDAFFAAVFDVFRSPNTWELFPGAESALGELRRDGRHLAILSEMDGRLLEVLDGFGLSPMFDSVLLSTRTGCSKRDGSLYLYALQHVHAPGERCAHIGDHLAWDVAGASAAGMAVVHFDSRGRQDAPPGVPSARHWSEIPALLRRLEAT